MALNLHVAVPFIGSMLAGRRAFALVGVIVCTSLAACGSSGHSSSAPTTPPQTGTTSTTPGGDASGELDTLPESPESAELPAPPSSIISESERAYLEEVFTDAQRFWEQDFRRAGVTYHPAHLTLFARAVHSGCGAQADAGPFYCPANRTIYLDVSFLQALARYAGVGPFGQAFIVGHEFGHHVQFLIGITHRVAALDEQDPGGTKARSVRVELQADCLAGVWAHSRSARGKLSDADLSDALRTAELVGDDFQQHASGNVVDSGLWTHGSSAQRQHWLKTGVQSGRPEACDTFASNSA